MIYGLETLPNSPLSRRGREPRTFLLLAVRASERYLTTGQIFRAGFAGVYTSERTTGARLYLALPWVAYLAWLGRLRLLPACLACLLLTRLLAC